MAEPKFISRSAVKIPMIEQLESRQLLSGAVPSVVAFEGQLVKEVHSHLKLVGTDSFDNLINAQQTKFTAAVEKKGGSYSIQSLATLTFEASAPILTASVVASNQISLSWTTLVGATSYNLEVSTNSGKTWTSLQNTSNTIFNDAGLSPAAHYSYRVTALMNSFASQHSKTTTITPGRAYAAQARKSAEIALGVKRFEQKLLLKVSANASRVDDPTFAASIQNTQVAFASRLERVGATYTPQSVGQILAQAPIVGGALGSPISSGAAIQTPVVTGTAVSPTEIDLSWSAIDGAIVYHVEFSTDKGASWQTLAYSAVNSFNDVNLTVQTAREYRVGVTTSVGTSAFSRVVSVTSQPDAPENLSVSNELSMPGSSSGSIDVSWTPVTGATGYIVGYTDSLEQTGGALHFPVTVTGDFAELAEIPAGDTVLVNVSAIGKAGQLSALTHASPILTPPAAPALGVSAASAAEVDLSWTPVSTATSYTIFRGDGSSFTAVQTVSGSTFSDIGLTPGTTFTYEVTANNDGGSSGPSEAVDAVTASG